MLTIEVVGEDGDLVERLDFQFTRDFMRQVPSGGQLRDLCCLRYVDPYGDTVFNRLQMDPFVRDLVWLRERAETEAERKAIDAVERLARAVTAEPHLYLKFLGD